MYRPADEAEVQEKDPQVVARRLGHDRAHGRNHGPRRRGTVQQAERDLHVPEHLARVKGCGRERQRHDACVDSSQIEAPRLRAGRAIERDVEAGRAGSSGATEAFEAAESADEGWRGRWQRAVAPEPVVEEREVAPGKATQPAERLRGRGHVRHVEVDGEGWQCSARPCSVRARQGSASTRGYQRAVGLKSAPNGGQSIETSWGATTCAPLAGVPTAHLARSLLRATNGVLQDPRPVVASDRTWTLRVTTTGSVLLLTRGRSRRWGLADLAQRSRLGERSALALPVGRRIGIWQVRGQPTAASATACAPSRALAESGQGCGDG